MAHSITYRKLLAIVLTALYAFIITPAQIWHSHSHSAAITAKWTEDGKSHENEQLSEDNTDGVCSICAQHFSVYTNNAREISGTITFTNGLSAGEYVCSLPNTPKPVFCNKGPPQLS